MPPSKKKTSAKDNSGSVSTNFLEEEMNFEEFSLDWFKGNTGRNILFLGNGFNLSVGVKTCYKNLFESIDKIEIVKQVLRKALGKNYVKKIKDKGYNLEDVLGIRQTQNQTGKAGDKQAKNAESAVECSDFVLRELYRSILVISKDGRIKPKAIKFFSLFSKFFTTNFDPLLYKFLETHRKFKAKGQTKKVMNEMRKIAGASEISKMEGRPPFPVSNLDQNVQMDIVHQVKKAEGRPLSKNALKRAIEKNEAGGAHLDFYDGFDDDPKNNKVAYWKKGRKGQNLFYLHGALHMYRDSRRRTCRLAMPTQTEFINEILSNFDGLMCVFENDSPNKEDKVSDHTYLLECHSALRKSSGILCIVGWDCSEKDEHLFKNVRNFDKVYVGIHEMKKVRRNYKKDPDNSILERYCSLFGVARVIFFDVEALRKIIVQTKKQVAKE